MSGVGALLAARLDQAALAQVLQHDLEQVLIVFSGKQARSELTENGKVKARILKLQAQGVLQVDPTAHRLGRLPVGQVLEELKHGDQSQAPGCYRQLTARIIQAGEHLIVVQNPDFIADPHQQVAFAECRPSNPGSFLGNRLNRRRTHRHWLPSFKGFHVSIRRSHRMTNSIKSAQFKIGIAKPSSLEKTIPCS